MLWYDHYENIVIYINISTILEHFALYCREICHWSDKVFHWTGAYIFIQVIVYLGKWHVQSMFCTCAYMTVNVSRIIYLLWYLISKFTLLLVPCNGINIYV